MSERLSTNKNSNEGDFDLEGALGDVDDDVDLVKEYGFSETNRERKEKGLAQYTKEEYDAGFLKMHQDGIVNREEDIKRDEKEIERLKEQLSTNDSKVADIKEILAKALKDGDSDLVGKTQELLKAWEENFNTDKILEKILDFQERIEGYKESIKHSKSILENLNKKYE